MAEFRVRDPQTHRVSVAQADLAVKDGVVVLEGVAKHVRVAVESELRRLVSHGILEESPEAAADTKSGQKPQEEKK